MPTTESQNYNRIYELLVSGENDLVGQIAYAVYKQQKIDKIKRFIENNGRIPEKSDLSSFTENAASEKQLGFYKEHALSILREFLEYTLDDQVNEIEAQKKADYDKRINDILNRGTPKGFMYGVWLGVFASFIFFAAGILLLLATGGWARIGKALIQLAQ